MLLRVRLARAEAMEPRNTCMPEVIKPSHSSPHTPPNTQAQGKDAGAVRGTLDGVSVSTVGRGKQRGLGRLEGTSGHMLRITSRHCALNLLLRTFNAEPNLLYTCMCQ
jgi:hypothetical protein